MLILFPSLYTDLSCNFSNLGVPVWSKCVDFFLLKMKAILKYCAFSMNWSGFGWGLGWRFFLVEFFKQQWDPRVTLHLNLQFKFSEITADVYLVRSDCCLQLAWGKRSILIQQLQTTSKFVSDNWYFWKYISCKKFIF